MKYAVIISIFFASIFLYLYFYGYLFEHEEEILSDLKDVTLDIETVFKSLDTDDNGVLNLSEFLNLKNTHRIFEKNVYLSESNYKVQEFPYLSVQLGEQIINIDVHFRPLLLSSLRKEVSAIPKEEVGSLQGLLDWKKPYKEKHPFGAKSFSAFLPQIADAKPGHRWWIVKSKLDANARPPPNQRHFPPKVEQQNLLVLHSLLGLFHPRPFLWTRFQPQGTVAIVRAIDANFYDIVFRVHAEFQLNQPPLHPFWFTPSQFRGRLIINKDGTVVKYFHMEVPDTKVNVDMEWLNDPTEDSMEVDIGYIPEMSLISSAISVPNADERGANQKLSSIEWSAEISLQQAFDLLESEFFPFKKAEYYSFPDAFHIASNQSKLVHGLVLWGNLADQSC